MVYVLMVDGFEEIEALTPVDVLRRCGAWVCTVGVNSKSVVGAHNIVVQCDIMFDELDTDAMKMLVLPGGPGHTALKTDKVHELLAYAQDKGAYIGAICAAPAVLGAIGLLKGRKATCFPGFEHELEGCTLVDAKVVQDGAFITAKGAGAAGDFAFALAQLMCGEQKAREIKDAMQY